MCSMRPASRACKQHSCTGGGGTCKIVNALPWKLFLKIIHNVLFDCLEVSDCMRSYTAIPTGNIERIPGIYEP